MSAVDDMLNTLSNKFAGVSSEIFAKSESPSPARLILEPELMLPATVDEMSRRLDNLEAAVKAKDKHDSGSKPS